MICSILAFREQVECIVDPGSQIFAMSEKVVYALNISYDPAVVLNMQSANKTVDHLFGLAQNVLFLFGDLVFYSQAHIIQEAAYDILLGCPFDIVAELLIKNYSNEDQTITIHYPNTN